MVDSTGKKLKGAAIASSYNFITAISRIKKEIPKPKSGLAVHLLLGAVCPLESILIVGCIAGSWSCVKNLPFFSDGAKGYRASRREESSHRDDVNSCGTS